MPRSSRTARVFYAYPYEPRNIEETITAAIEKLRTDGVIRDNRLRFRMWSDSSESGKRLISTILEQIDRNHVFACDLTYPNPNVSFELGYAIARFKRIFASLNPTIARADKDYGRIYFSLLNMAFTAYQNHQNLAESLVKEKPWESLQDTLLEDRFHRQLPRLEAPTLFYMKPPLNTDSVIAVQEQFSRSVFGESIILDDPNEYSSQILEWYAEKILVADAVVVHLLSTEHENHRIHNLRASIVAGLSRGFRKPMIMLAHTPYEPPVDYERWLVTHDTAAECLTRTNTWLGKVEEELPHRRPRRRGHSRVASRRMDLRSLFLGDPVAEHESEQLYDYFVETSSFYQAMAGPLTIMVGRRGTGKTAILYAIQSEMRNTPGNYVTVVKPIGYETHGLIRVLESVREISERGFLIESLWKYLIYSEIANSVAIEIRELPLHRERTENERAFLEYFEDNADILNQPFSERIENAVLSLEGLNDIQDAGSQRLRISEDLHNSRINDLRQRLGAVLTDVESLSLLIDGLDEPWGPGQHVTHLAELIGGLLEVAQYIPADFRRSSSRVQPVNVKVTILLRSDIFAFIQHLLPEQDKLPIERVTWNDRELLFRVLEERMLHGAPRGQQAQQVWNELFPSDVVGVTPREFIGRTVLPRPRDLIHFVKASISSAVNRGNRSVMPDDLLKARHQYSQYAFDSILKEDDPSKGKLEAVLYEFSGADSEITRDDIETRFSKVGVEGEDVDFYLDLLCDVSFLGIETRSGFQFSAHEEERRTLRNVARVLATNQSRREKFVINPAFYQVLQIE